MRMRPQDRKEDKIEHVPKEQGLNFKEPKIYETNRQEINQEWIQVHSKKASSSRRNKTIQQREELSQEEKEENNIPLTPIMVEEGEIVEEQETEPAKTADDLTQNRPQLKKCNSANNLSDQIRREGDKDKEFLVRLEYLREDFNHLHLISKHLRKTEEEAQRRMKLMEMRRNQNYNYLEDIQQYSENLSQDELCSKVPETQLGSSHNSKAGEPSQKKKKAVQNEKKPLTRAAKKQLSPKK